MFTGIVTAIGKIERAQPLAGDVRLTIDSGTLGLDDLAIGDSIAVSGACLTVVAIERSDFLADVSEETLRCTVGLEVGSEVNLEKSLRLSDRLGGHLVSGHVDGVGQVLTFERMGESWLLRVRVPEDLVKYIARKGSITVDGVSLTVNEIGPAMFEVNLIPHTLEVTTLKHLKVGRGVNLEVDMIARYVERILSSSNTVGALSRTH
jgi:riboflavin synthase